MIDALAIFAMSDTQRLSFEVRVEMIRSRVSLERALNILMTDFISSSFRISDDELRFLCEVMAIFPFVPTFQRLLECENVQYLNVAIGQNGCL
ncbi:MAG: hypothetical protein ACW992_12125, partial [Candidatus Thorarchaeota archaeon]